MGIKVLHVSTVPGSGVYTEIRRAFASGATKLVAKPADAQAHLRILSEVREKNVYTITGAGRVYEHQLRLFVRYELAKPGQAEPVIPPTEVEARRVLTYNEAAPIAKEAEEALLFKDMQVELADRILRQVTIARKDM